MSNQSLLGKTPSWNPMMFVGAVVGACLATILVATNTSNSSLYTATTPSVQTAAVAARAVGSVGSRASQATVAAAQAQDFEDISSPTSTKSATWVPLAAAFPLAIAAAIAAFRSTRKAVVLDPIDMLDSSGAKWSMLATTDPAVARNYANALIELGQEGQCLEQLHNDMDNFGAMLADEAFTSFFNNPMTVGDKQKEIIAKVCEEAQMSPISKNFLSFLVDKKRITALPAIIREFDELFYDASGTQVATVTAAVPLSEDQLRMIANKLHELTKGKNIKIKSEVDSELLAGFVLQYGRSGSQRIDLSLKGQLNELKGDLQQGILSALRGGVPVGAQLTIAAIGVNAVLAGEAKAGSGNVFDFGLTMPLQMVQFLLLMVFLDKVVFSPVGKVIDDRVKYIKESSSQGADNTKEIAALNAKAEQLLEEARRDAARELEKAKKEATKQGAEKLAKAKADMDASLKRSLAEVQKSKEELWARLEAEVVPVLADDIVNKLLAEEPVQAAAAE